MRAVKSILGAGLLGLFACGVPVWADDAKPTPPPAVKETAKPEPAKADVLEVIVDVSETPEHQKWADEAAELVKVWHPKLSDYLKSDGYTPPKKITLQFKKDMKGVAHTIGDRIVIAGDWITKHPEDKGMVVHELTHAIQGYRRAPRNAGWLVEGIADYTRFYLFEQSVLKPEELRRARYANPDRSKYTDSYRTTASFLNYLVENVDPQIVVKLNAQLRDGKYSEKSFEELAKKPLSEAEVDWKETLKKK
ncbi:MAG: basic secretory protein-like protein [Pirellulales bacterium]